MPTLKSKAKEIYTSIPVRSPAYKTTTSKFDKKANSFVTIPSMEVQENTYSKTPKQIMKIEKPKGLK